MGHGSTLEDRFSRWSRSSRTAERPGLQKAYVRRKIGVVGVVWALRRQNEATKRPCTSCVTLSRVLEME